MGKWLRLLIVEDVEDHALLIVRELQKGGFDTAFERVDTFPGLQAALNGTPDAIISDFSLPGFSALDALRLVQERGLDLPFIIVSGVMGEDTAVEAMKAGAHDFILKGKYSRLVPALERELHEAELRRERRSALEELLLTHEELKAKQAELEKHHSELRLTYHQLERETAQRLRAVHELRQRDQMVIQQARLAAMGELLNNIAHQWRQPLNVLGLKVQEIGFCYDLGGCTPELMAGNVAQAMEILQQLSQTIDDFRTFANPDLERRPFDVEQVVGKTLSLIEESFRERGIALHVVASESAPVEGFPNQYCQALLNILMNARDAFGEQGREDARITLSLRREEGRAVLSVADNAGGIDENILDKVFDAYFTTKQLGKGTGIGLFMAKNIIEKNMGGRLTVRNVPGGAEFRIEL